MKIIKIALLFCIALVLVKCAALTSKEVGRVQIDTISDAENMDWKEVKLDLKAGEKLWFWTDMSIIYDDELELEYQVQLIRDSDTLGYIKLHPFEKKVTIGEIKSSVLGHTDWSFQGQMDFLQIEKSGQYTFRVILVSSLNETLKLNKADLVLKK
ncbi:MAG: hypothetical protein K0S33_84 [Bacteroidetes bacterium]|jgi:hypothetical protein|nr:hypothetical protein [Bacteroidota bacterium]